MLKSLEVKKALLDIQTEVKALVEAEQPVPQELADKFASMKVELKNALDEESSARKTKNVYKEDKMEKKVFNQAFKALLKGETQTYYDTVGTYGNVEATNPRGGYLIDTEMLPLDEYGAELTAIPARVIPVWSPKGNIPNIDMSQATSGNFLQSFDEIDSLAQTNPVFGNVSYTCAEKGAIVPVSNRLLNDAQADVVAVIGRVFGIAAVADRNAQILTAIDAIGSLTTKYLGANKTFADKEGIKAIREAILKNLGGINRAKAKIVVCDTTFAKLAAIEDSVGHPFICQDVTNPSIYRLEGHEIVAIDDCFMTSSNTLTEAVYVGNFDRVAAIQRQGLEISTDTSNMFDKDAVAVKGKVYNCVKVLEDKAFIKILGGAQPG